MNRGFAFSIGITPAYLIAQELRGKDRFSVFRVGHFRQKGEGQNRVLNGDLVGQLESRL